MSMRARHARVVAIAASDNSTMIQRPAWQNDAACIGQPPSAFFEEMGNAPDWRERAKALCNSCEVQTECLTYAIETNQGAGVWGGFDTPERREIARTMTRGFPND